MILSRENPCKSICHIAFFITLIFCSSVSMAGIYKWVDKDGNVHYGQQRPTSAPSQKMDVQQYAPRDTATYKKPGSKDQAAENKDKENANNKPAEETKPEKKPETRAEKKRRLAACAQARSNLSSMEAIGRIRSVDKDGNTRYLSQKEKEAKMSKTGNLISKHCK